MANCRDAIIKVAYAARALLNGKFSEGSSFITGSACEGISRTGGANSCASCGGGNASVYVGMQS
jgi:hypothetical protein